MDHSSRILALVGVSTKAGEAQHVKELFDCMEVSSQRLEESLAVLSVLRHDRLESRPVVSGSTDVRSESRA